MTDAIQRKADRALAQTLAAAQPGEQFTVILELVERPSPQGELPELESLSPGERSRSAEGLDAATATFNHPTLRRLSDLGLNPRGGRFGPLVVVTGSAEAMRDALALYAVRRATLDQPLELIAPETPDRRQK